MNPELMRAEIARIAGELAPMCGEDETLFADMIEGETDLHHIVQYMHDQRMRDEEMLAGIAERKADLLAREKRIKDRSAKWKAEIGKFLRVAKLAKLELPEVTYSVREGKSRLVVVDADAVPDNCTTLVRKPVMAAINDEYGAADKLPNWLVREPASDIVTGRTK